jgi:hypothetical protein
MTKIVITGRRIKPDNDEYIVEAIKAEVDERKKTKTSEKNISDSPPASG